MSRERVMNVLLVVCIPVSFASYCAVYGVSGIHLGGSPVEVGNVRGLGVILAAWLFGVVLPAWSCRVVNRFSFLACVGGLAFASVSHVLLLLGQWHWWCFIPHFVLFELLLWGWLRTASDRPVASFFFSLPLSMPNGASIGIAFLLWQQASFPKYMFMPVSILLTVCTALVLLVVFVMASEKLLFRRKRVDSKGAACAACGYNLTGNVGGICPECGSCIPEGQRAALQKP